MTDTMEDLELCKDCGWFKYLGELHDCVPRYMDIKDPPRTELEYHERWKNHLKSKLVSAIGRKIEVK